MVALQFDPQVTSSSVMEATLTLSRDRTQTREVDTTVTAMGWRGLILAAAPELWTHTTHGDGAQETGHHAWLDMTLPTGARIRPLVQLSPRTEGGATARFVHLFPSDRHAIEAYQATRSASY